MGWFQDLAFAKYLRSRTHKRKSHICRRRIDGTLWAASSPQNLGVAMRGLFTKAPTWHFAKVRVWRGVTIVSRKVFWAFNDHGRFDLLEEKEAFWLPAWPENVETAKIDGKT